MRKNYNPYNYCNCSDDLKIDEVYQWFIDGEYYNGTLIDFIETFGEKRQYKIKCDDCGEYNWVSGSVIKEKGMVCKKCRADRRARMLKEKAESIAEKNRLQEIERNKSLADLRPDVLNYWSEKNECKPEEIYQLKSSSYPVYLICPLCGIEFRKTYAGVIRTGAYCKSCARRVNVAKEKSLAYLYPEVAKWYDATNKNKLSSKEVSACSNYSYWFKCPDCGGLFESSLNSVINSYKKGHTGCKICAGYKVVAGINDILTKNKPSAMYWDYDKNTEDPSTILYSDETMRWFKCEKGHSYQRTPFRMLRSYNKGVETLCPVCRGTEVIAGVNDVKTLNEWAYKYWDYEKNDLKPEEVYYKSDVAYWFKCSKGHSFKRAVSGMLRSYNKSKVSNYNIYEGCVVCQNHKSPAKLEVGVNDLLTVRPDLMDRWDYEINDQMGIKPWEVTVGSQKEVWVKCSNPNCTNSYPSTVRSFSQKHTIYCEDCRCRQISAAETEIAEILKDKGVSIKTQYRLSTSGKSVDIYIPDKKIAFDYNGLYWHNEEKGRGGSYHLDKIKECKNQGIRLYYIWEDDYRDKKDVVISWMLNKLGYNNHRKVNARDCTIKVVGKIESENFLNKYHIQGNSLMSTTIGLYLNDELVALMSLSFENSTIHLKRYATSCNVRGGFSKLLSFVKTRGVANGYNKIVTFSDNSLSDGDIYKNNGFLYDGDLKPTYYYIVNHTRCHKFNYRKKRFKEDKSLLYKEGLTEDELADLNGLKKVYDAGKIRWVYNLETSK